MEKNLWILLSVLYSSSLRLICSMYGLVFFVRPCIHDVRDVGTFVRYDARFDAQLAVQDKNIPQAKQVS